MENNKQIYGYFLGIYNYEKYLPSIYDKMSLSKINDFQGFLIELSDYEKFKNSICYDKLLKAADYGSYFSKEHFSRLVNKYNLYTSNK